MRRIIILLLAVIGSACEGHWTPVTQPAPAAWRAVRALPGGFGWAAGDGGLVFATADGGLTWSPQPTPLTNNILSVDFGSPFVGWISGSSGDAAYTGDGGQNWVGVRIANDDLGIGLPDSIAPVSVPDETHAWALARWSDATFVYHTANSGGSWATVPYTNHGYSSPNTLYSLAFTSDASGWMVASRIASGGYVPVLLRTVDGGATWQAFDAPPTQLNNPSDPSWEVSIQAMSSNRVWVHIWDTTNNQGSLFLLNLPSPSGAWAWSVWPWNNRVRDISFKDLTRGVLVGDSTWDTPDSFATIHRTVVAGASPLAASFASPAEGYAAGPDGMIYRWIPDLWGDANQDGRVDLLDACVIADLAAGGTPDPAVSRSLSDLNGDGQVTVADAARALRIAGGLSM